MASYKVRRLLRGTGGGRLGSADNYTDFSTSGLQTMAGTARVYKEIWIPAEGFRLSGNAGSMTTACLNIDLSASLGLSVPAGSAMLESLQPSANITGSPTFAVALIPKPLDAATTGSIQARAVWTSHDDLTTTGCVFVAKASMVYISSSAVTRTTASTSACLAYNYTASATWHETSLGNLASFGANDVAAAVYLAHDQTNAADTAGSPIAFLGLKLRYLSDKLGTESS